jgi:hypothetical protein
MDGTPVTLCLRINWTYDVAGNQKLLPSRTFIYDKENRLVASTQPNIAGHQLQPMVERGHP